MYKISPSKIEGILRTLKLINDAAAKKNALTAKALETKAKKKKAKKKSIGMIDRCVYRVFILSNNTHILNQHIFSVLNESGGFMKRYV